jgi:hypothetical protein
MNYGNLVIEDIKVGDIYYEYVNGIEIECEVITLPVFNDSLQTWTWTSRNTLTNNEIHYRVSEGVSEVSYSSDDLQ